MCNQLKVVFKRSIDCWPQHLCCRVNAERENPTLGCGKSQCWCTQPLEGLLHEHWASSISIFAVNFTAAFSCQCWLWTWHVAVNACQTAHVKEASKIIFKIIGSLLYALLTSRSEFLKMHWTIDTCFMKCPFSECLFFCTLPCSTFVNPINSFLLDVQ